MILSLSAKELEGRICGIAEELNKISLALCHVKSKSQNFKLIFNHKSDFLFNSNLSKKLFIFRIAEIL